MESLTRPSLAIRPIRRPGTSGTGSGVVGRWRARSTQRDDAPTTMTTYQQKITFGEMRVSGVRDVGLLPRSERQANSFCSLFDKLGAAAHKLVVGVYKDANVRDITFFVEMVAVCSNLEFEFVCSR